MVEAETETLGQRIRRLRLEAGLSQNEFAVKVHASPATVRQWEHDRAEPLPVRISGLCRVLHCSRAELLPRPKDQPGR